MSLKGLIEADGGTLKKQATTGGGEYAGPCPWCGGNDRFRVWPESGRYWCRGCDKKGDSIQYLRERRGLSYQEACLFVGREPGPRKDTARPALAPWTPKEAKSPPELWQAKAGAFLDRAVSCLWSRHGDEMRRWLRDVKGLNNETIKQARLGYHPADINEPRATWGLPELLDKVGKEKTLWIPAGLVISHIVGGAVQRLRIRRDNPGDGAPYVIVSGSSAAHMTWGQDKGAAVIVESELDGLLLYQEAGDLSGVLAIGTVKAKPDVQTDRILKDAPLVLISLDTDDAGAKASWAFWPDTYGKKARRWPTIKGKDASEARLNGLDLREWIVAGIFGTFEKYERFCIQTVDGRLSDAEALKTLGLIITERS
jgi:DNA primase